MLQPAATSNAARTKMCEGDLMLLCKNCLIGRKIKALKGIIASDTAAKTDASSQFWRLP